MIVSVKKKRRVKYGESSNKRSKVFIYAFMEPQAINGSEPKYSVSLIIPKKGYRNNKGYKGSN